MQVQQSSVPLFFVFVCPTKIYERPRRFTHGGHPHSPRADGRATAAAMTWTPRRVPPSRQLQLQGWSLQRPQSECPQLCCCGHPLEGQQHSVGTLRGCCSGNGAARPPVLQAGRGDGDAAWVAGRVCISTPRIDPATGSHQQNREIQPETRAAGRVVPADWPTRCPCRAPRRPPAKRPAPPPADQGE